MSNTLTNPENVTSSAGRRDAITAKPHSPLPWSVDPATEMHQAYTIRSEKAAIGFIWNAGDAQLAVDRVNQWEDLSQIAERWRERADKAESQLATALRDLEDTNAMLSDKYSECDRLFDEAESIKDALDRAEAERDRLRDIVRRLLPSLRRDIAQCNGPKQAPRLAALLDEARAAIGEDTPCAKS